ncbi:hypothetical protein DOU54_14300 [Agrobacterium sp. MS2]|nr:hypothetical protein DOU54_14300 [Agrobacterium sp. MS2]
MEGRSFQLDRWQERIIRKVYGDTKPDGTRRIKTVFALIPRGNRKTTLGAALCLLALGPERIPGSQVVSAAVDRDQARIALEEMKGVISAHPKLEAAFQVQDTKNRITHRKSAAFYRAMSADAATAHGRTISLRRGQAPMGPIAPTNVLIALNAPTARLASAKSAILCCP